MDTLSAQNRRISYMAMALATLSAAAVMPQIASAQGAGNPPFTEAEKGMFQGALPGDVPEEMIDRYADYQREQAIEAHVKDSTAPPAHPVEGFQHQIFSENSAQRLNAAIQAAYAANRACDPAAYEAARRQFDNVRLAAEEQTDIFERRLQEDPDMIASSFLGRARSSHDALVIQANEKAFPLYIACEQPEESDAMPPAALDGVSDGGLNAPAGADVDLDAALEEELADSSGYEETIARTRNLIPFPPGFSVRGFKHNLYNGIVADKITSLIGQMRDAILRCDRAAYQEARQELESLELAMDTAIRSGDTPVLNRMAEENLEHSTFGATFDGGHRDQHDHAVISANYDVFPQYPEPCENLPQSARRDPLVILGAQLSQYDFDQFYLGQEPVGATTPELDQVAVPQEVDTAGFMAGMQIPLDGPLADYVRFVVSYSEASGEGSLGSFDPAGDNRLLLPGPEGGPSGLSLGDAPGFSNTAENITHGFELSDIVLELTVPVNIMVAEGGAFDYALQAGLVTQFTDYRSSFSGSLPGYDGDFGYDTDIDIDRIGIMAGVEAEVPFGAQPGNGIGSRTVRAPSVAALFGGQVEVSNYDVTAEDSLSWSVFNGGTTGGGTSVFEGDEVRFDGSAYAGLRIYLQPAVVDLFAEYGTQAVPQVVRDGTNPTVVELDNKSQIGANVQVRFPF